VEINKVFGHICIMITQNVKSSVFWNPYIYFFQLRWYSWMCFS
jgi:hypothetical protein